MTPRELTTWIRGAMRADKARQERLRANMYSMATLIRSAVWADSMPSYETLFGKKDEDMDDEAMFQVARALNAACGGSEE